MKASELIEKLQAMPPDTLIVVEVNSDVERTETYQDFGFHMVRLTPSTWNDGGYRESPDGEAACNLSYWRFD